MRTVCPECMVEIETPYILLGSSIKCSACDNVIIPTVENGTRMPYTGSEITFTNFVQLLTHGIYTSLILRILENDYPEFKSVMKSTNAIVPGSQEENFLVEIHKKIQSNPSTQEKLYQAAMSIWR